MSTPVRGTALGVAEMGNPSTPPGSMAPRALREMYPRLDRNRNKALASFSAKWSYTFQVRSARKNKQTNTHTPHQQTIRIKYISKGVFIRLILLSTRLSLTDKPKNNCPIIFESINVFICVYITGNLHVCVSTKYGNGH